MKLRKMVPVVIGLVALLIAAIGISGMIWPRINDVKTGETPEYPNIQPQTFKASPYQVFDAAASAARDLGWSEIVEDRGNGRIHAVATTMLFRFKDDVTITIQPDGPGLTMVHMRSHSRVGRGDLGANARRILKFQAELARRL